MTEELFTFPEDRAISFQRMMYKARSERQLTQGQLAEAAGVSQSTVNLMENGPTPRTTFVASVKVFQALGISPDHAARVLGLLPSGDLDELEDEQAIQSIIDSFVRLPRDKRKVAEASIKALLSSLK